MRTATTLIVGTAMTCSVAGTASADFVGMYVGLEAAGQMTISGPRDVYHVFAEFTGPADRVNSWFGSNESPFVIQNVLADGITLGSGFFQIGGSGGQLPPKEQGLAREWDTYATIGIRYGYEADGIGGDGTVLTDFPPFINGNSVTSSVGDASLFMSDYPQGRADFRVNGQDTSLRVLLMQLTVQVGQHVRGTLNVSGQVDTPSGPQSFTALGQTFNSVPAPGAFVCLAAGMSLLFSRRR